MRGNIRSGRLPMVFVAIAVTIGACGGAATPSPSPTPTEAPTPAYVAPTTVEPSQSPEPTAAVTIYVVRSGDTLIAIAKKFNITLKALREANPQVTDPRLMQVGEKLTIPAP